VSRDSAIIGDARENRETIHADHMGMVKFATRDSEYGKIRFAIEMLLEGLSQIAPSSAHPGMLTVTYLKLMLTGYN
jgi:hypothetical protein